MRDGVWYDIAYEPGTAVEKYQPDAGQPSDLDDFARLGRDLVVVLGHRAYGIVRSALPVRPVLLQNFPNPFNPETLIRFQLPADGYVELAVYNLSLVSACVCWWRKINWLVCTWLSGMARPTAETRRPAASISTVCRQADTCSVGACCSCAD